MSSYEVRAIKFIRKVYPYICDCQSVIDFDEAIDDFNEAYHRKVKLDNGATRMVFISSDYVVKLDYNPIKIKSWGGCEQEHKFYNKAYKEGYAHLFAKIKPYYYKGMVFYIMPKINGVGNHFADAWYYMTKEEEDWCWDNGLRDLHSYNYGMTRHGIVIIDYAANDYRT